MRGVRVEIVNKGDKQKFYGVATRKKRRKKKTFNSYDDAYAWAKATYDRMRYCPPEDQLGTKVLSVNQLIESYKFNSLCMLKANTQKNYEFYAAYLSKKIGTLPLTIVRTAHFLEIRDNLIEAKYNPSFIAKYFMFFKILWKYAIKEERMADINYPANVQLPKQAARKNKSIKKEELEFVLKYALSESPSDKLLFFKVYILLSVFTGLRKSNVLSITWDMIDHIHHTIYFSETKNGHEHTVYLPPVVYSAINNLPRRNMSRCKKFIFANYTTRLKNFAKKHSLSHIHPHRFRHTASTLIAETNISDIDHARLMGHLNIANTLHYTGQSIDRKAVLGDRIQANTFEALNITF